METQKRKLHAELLAEICDNINDKVGNFSKFKATLRGIGLKPVDLSDDKSIFDILDSMESRGKLGIGNYEWLKFALGEDHKNIIDKIEKKEMEMNSQNPGIFFGKHREDQNKNGPKFKNKQLHHKMLADISDCLSSRELERLKSTKLKALGLNATQLSKDKTFHDISSALESKGLIGVGKYENLKYVFKGDHNDIVEMIRNTEKPLAENINKAVKSNQATRETDESVIHSKQNPKGSMDTDESKAYSKQNLRGTLERKHMPDDRKVGARKSGIKLRRTDDVTLNYEEVENLIAAKVKERVGNIKVGDEQGTGFRVGKNLVMSAYHIFEPYLDAKWAELAAIIQKELEKEPNLLVALKFILPLPEQKSVLETASKSSDMQIVLQHLRTWRNAYNPCKTFLDMVKLFHDRHFTELATALKSKIQDIPSADIIFADIRDKDSGLPFTLNLQNIVFYNVEYDVVLLNLIEDQGLPERFVLRKTTQTHMHLLGHPQNKKLKLDPGCEVYTMDQTVGPNLHTAINRAKAWFKDEENEKLKGLHSIYDRLEEDANQKEMVLFHCSKSITHGASGSPGVVRDLDKLGHFKVQTMLQCGHPSVRYLHSQDFPPYCLFESGLSMEKLYSLMDKVEGIRDDVFRPL